MRLAFILAIWWSWGISCVSGVVLPAETYRENREREAFARGSQLSGMGFGVALGTLANGGTVRHDWAVVQVQHSVVVSGLLAEDRWFRGRVLLGGDYLIAQQYQPDSGFLFGATPMVRYLFETDRRWKPFIEGGFGFALTDIGGPSLSGTLQFSPQGGVGVYWLWRPNLALGVQQRFAHYSNGGRRSPNAGLNQHVSLLSVTRFH